MSTTAQTAAQNVKQILNDLFRAKLIDVDSEGALARIQDGREDQRAPMIASLQQARVETMETGERLAAKRVTLEEAVKKAEADLREKKLKLAAMLSEEAGMSHHLDAKASHLEKCLRELSDPILGRTLQEINRLSELGSRAFASVEWRQKTTWHKIARVDSNLPQVRSLVDGVRLVAARIQQMQIEPRPTDLVGQLQELVAPIEAAASELCIKTRWPWKPED